MPWKEVSLMSQRIEFLRLACLEGANISRLAERFGISRKTAYKWLRCHERGEPLANKSRRPKSSPGRTASDTEALVLLARETHPAWGGRKIRAWLHNRQGYPLAELPAASTITEILRRNGRLDGPRAGQPRDWQRFENPAPNGLWQMDFKGHVGMACGRRCHPLTVLDDHSRYAVGLVACTDETLETVQTTLTRIFTRYGLPARMLMDNGSPWGDEGGQPHTRLTVWLMRQGIRVTHGRPYHPQTQGKDERFHRTLKAEVLSRVTLIDTDDAQRRFDDWRAEYNHERPHEALGLKPPVSRYRPSPRDFVADPPPPEYPAGTQVRKVCRNGRFSWRGREWRFSKAFAAMPVGLRRDAAGAMRVWFGPHHLGRLDETAGTVVRERRPGSSGEAGPGPEGNTEPA